MDELLRGNYSIEQPKQADAAAPTLEDQFELGERVAERFGHLAATGAGIPAQGRRNLREQFFERVHADRLQHGIALGGSGGEIWVHGFGGAWWSSVTRKSAKFILP